MEKQGVVIIKNNGPNTSRPGSTPFPYDQSLDRDSCLTATVLVVVGVALLGVPFSSYFDFVGGVFTTSSLEGTGDG